LPSFYSSPSVRIPPNYIDAYNDLGNILAKTGQIESAESVYRQAIAANPNHFGTYLNLGNILWKQNQVEQAVEAYHNALKLNPNNSEIINNLITILENSGRNSEAVKIASEASLLLPQDLSFKLRKHLMLPMLYETKEEIEWYRNQFTQGLEKIIQQTSLETPEAIDNALTSIGYSTNFYLAYQGYNDLELQKQYGQLVHRIMAVKYPQWVQHLPMPPLSQNGKIRVGYISGYMQAHSAARWALGWLKYSNQQNFEIYCYYIGNKVDSITQQFQLNSNFHHIPEDLEAACQQIVNDKLHILMFTDIGILPQTTQMAGLRLAPVQCTAWGHPITSGLPTIDYYLSSDLMEPENAEEHYSEQLIRLPNIGISYPKPTIPELSKNRADFHLWEDAVVYLSCQSLFKYLPQYDYIYPTIAKRVPQAQFAFISHTQTQITAQFRQRLQRAFASVDLNSEDYCVILPRQDWLGYGNLNLISDVFLDTISWSGGNTTLEAIACHLPVVTCPGEFMRGRHSYAILKMLGVTETIAQDADEYIEIAVRLGLDSQWRNSIVEQISDRNSCLYDDQTCVMALEAFYQSVVWSN